VHPTGGSRRVFGQFAWLEVGSGKMALSRPAHPRVTHTVSLLKSGIDAKTRSSKAGTCLKYSLLA